MPFTKFAILPFWIIIFIFSTRTAFSQTQKIDSLKAILLKAKEDTNKFRLYYNIAGEYWMGLKDTIDLLIHLNTKTQLLN